MKNNNSRNFKNIIAKHPGGEHVLDCFLCGTCTAGCPVSEIDGDFNPRKIMRQILNGLKDEIITDGEIWKCNQCHICVAHCPQDVRFADIIRVLRVISVEDGLFSIEFENKIKDIDKETREQRLERVKVCLKNR